MAHSLSAKKRIRQNLKRRARNRARKSAIRDEVKVFNGYCGAESGFVPVSTVAPSVLVTEIELQRTRKDSGRPPILPSPWATPLNTAKR